jgi:hypothetical protein
MPAARIKAELRTKLAYQPSAECNAEGCTWKHRCSPSTRVAAKDHVRMAGHPVIIETLTVEEWEPV